MACRYFSCSRLLEESEEEAGAKGKTTIIFNKTEQNQDFVLCAAL